MQASSSNSPPSWWQLSAIFAVSLALRLFFLGHQNFWYDEILTLQTAAVPWPELVQHLGVIEGSTPPLYFSIVHLLQLADANEFLVRLPSAVFGAGACVFAFLIGIELLGLKCGLIVGLLMAFSPMQIWYSQEARMYGLLQFCGSMAFWFALRFLSSGRRRELLAYALSALAASYTFIYGFFLIGFALLFSLAKAPPSKAVRSSFVWCNLILLGLFAPWFALALRNVHAARGVQFAKGNVSLVSLYTGGVLGLGSSLGPSASELQAAGIGAYSANPIATASLAVGLFLLIYFLGAGLITLSRTNRRAFYFSIGGLLVFWGGPAAVNLLKPTVTNNPRYAILAAIPLCLALATGLAQTFVSRSITTFLRAAFAGLLLLSLFNHYFVPAYAKIDIRGAAAFLQASGFQPDFVVVNPAYLIPVFEHYAKGPAQVRGLTLTRAPADADALEKVREEAMGTEYFALLYARPDHGDPARVLPGKILEFSTVAKEAHSPGVRALILTPKPAASR